MILVGKLWPSDEVKRNEVLSMTVWTLTEAKRAWYDGRISFQHGVGGFGPRVVCWQAPGIFYSIASAQQEQHLLRST